MNFGGWKKSVLEILSEYPYISFENLHKKVQLYVTENELRGFLKDYRANQKRRKRSNVNTEQQANLPL